jgi:hypothetical protein
MRDLSRIALRRATIVPVLLLAAVSFLAAQPLVGAPLQAAQPCPASPAWVSSPSEPDFNVDPPTICAFYQYSWQSFLYLTSPAAGAGGAVNFETFPSVADVFGQGAALKAAANRRLGAPTLFRDERIGRLRTFQVRGSEPLDAIEQAGSNGVLVDQNGNVTYYEQYLDPIATSFILGCNLNITACQTTTAAANLRFPAGAIELKISWRPLPAGTPNANTYYTLENVEVFNPQANNGQGANVTVNLGLAGFHLVYTTANHKEMVWATFEHIDNAPDGPCAGATAPPPGFSGWAFNNAASTDCTNINKFPKTTPPYAITQAVRNYAEGSDSSASGQTNAATIQALNNSVLGILPPSSVWSNYFLVGAVWTNSNGNANLPAVGPPTTNVGFNEFGSTFLSNATLETFTQWPNPIAGSTSGLHVNCFSCHNAETTGTNPPNPPAFKVSHAFGNGNSNACPYTTTLPPACTNSQTLTLQLVSAHAKKAPAKKK